MSDLHDFLFNRDIGIRSSETGHIVAHTGVHAVEAILAIVEELHIVFPTVSAASGAAGIGAGTVGGLAMAVGGPVLGMAGVFMALGSGYAAAREEIQNEAVASGFSQGLVCGLLNMSPGTTKRLFAQHGVVHRNPFDPESDTLQMNARNRGLVAGYAMAKQASEDEKKAYLFEIRPFTGDISAGAWTDRDKVDYVITYAAKLRLHFLQH